MATPEGSPGIAPDVMPAGASIGGRAAMARALEAQLPQIVRLAERLLRPGLEVDDLVQEGCVGWLRAARTGPDQAVT